MHFTLPIKSVWFILNYSDYSDREQNEWDTWLTIRPMMYAHVCVMKTTSNGNISALLVICDQWPVNSPHKDQWRGAFMFSLICAWINGWVNNRETGDLRRHHAHYDVTVMVVLCLIMVTQSFSADWCGLFTPIFSIYSMALGHSYGWPSAHEATPEYMGKLDQCQTTTTIKQVWTLYMIIYMHCSSP